MLDLNPEIVCFIIDRAHAFQVKEQVVIPEEPTNPGDDWGRQVLADHSSDLTYLELKSTIEDLEPDQQVTLIALMWVGRGDYDVKNWETAVQDAQDSWNTRTANYLIGTPLLADYLSEALDLLGYSCES